MSLTGIGPISAMQGSCGTAGAWRRWSLANDEERCCLSAADLLLPTSFLVGKEERELLFCRHRGVILPRALHDEAVGRSLVMECVGSLGWLG